MQVNELFNLSGKTALVTGCSRGIGEAMAIALAEAGADIIGVSGTLQPSSNVENAVKKNSKQFSPYRIDLGNHDELYQSINKINEAHPVIDILIHVVTQAKIHTSWSHSLDTCAMYSALG